MKRGNFVLGFLLGAVLFGGTTTFAAGVIATPFSELNQRITLNGEEITLTGYNINGNNYFKLRDIGEAVGFGVTWEGDTRTVAIDTEAPYEPEQTAFAPITEKVLTGDDRARMDFSQQANAEAFNEVYTRAAYNAIRQSITDRDTILAGNNETGFCESYAYAHTTAGEETNRAMTMVLSHIGVYYRYQKGVEPYATGQYQYPDYFICKVETPAAYAQAADSITSELAAINALATDAEKVSAINGLVCDRLTYAAGKSAMPNKVFSSSAVTESTCSGYARCVQFLCDLAGIPCVQISSQNHGWNMVYVNGEWLHIDCVANDVGDALSARNAVLMVRERTNRQMADAYPACTAFAMELLAPGSTK